MSRTRRKKPHWLKDTIGRWFLIFTTDKRGRKETCRVPMSGGRLGYHECIGPNGKKGAKREHAKNIRRVGKQEIKEQLKIIKDSQDGGDK